MKNLLTHLLLLVAAVLAPAVCRAADVTLMPVNVHLDRNNDRTTVQVVNNGSEPVIMQAEAIAWSRVDGKDIDGPTTDIIVNPPVFTVKPGQTQVVRVGLRRSQDLQQEATYRMVLREVPGLHLGDVGSVNGSVRVLVSLRVPIYVAPMKIVRDQQWKLQSAADGDVIAKVSNAGNVHMKIADLRLQGEGSEGLVIEQKGPQAVIFPGEERSYRLKRAVAATGDAGGAATLQATRLQIRTDQGVEHVALVDSQP